ncbi:acyl-CoA synthetase [Rhodopila sp.]|uniref:acyl-CoA synthetase n=1 Tax=Rhodopila sp. TaxID=2480087 RepID=UPI002D0BBB58|nr:acyl-CoA synthetase [Rhodopila sp.]HVZ07608.1 acyl-CoA synthetase [Rhodopila sp.]
MSIFDQDLDRTPANHVPLSPVSFLTRAARIYPDRVAVIHGDRRFTYGQFLERVRRLASALAKAGVGKGDTVAIMAPNTPQMLEAHYAVPMLGAVLCSINIRLDSAAIGFILGHSESKVVLTDTEFAAVMRPAIHGLNARVVDIDDVGGLERVGTVEYEDFLAAADPSHPVRLPDDEWQAIALNYTSGTTGNPKGVVAHHRGAYLNACANALTFQLSPQSVYLWTLPMFHCNGWTYTWAVTLAGGTHVCLRRVEPALIFAAIADHGVTHMCGAPVVLSMLIHAPDAARRSFPQTVKIATGGAAPPSTVIAQMEAMGFAVTHLYGLTETYGPSTVCLWQPGLDEMPIDRKAAFMARQGVITPMIEDAAVMDPDTMTPLPADGTSMGELMLRGNTVMKGYLKNQPATAEAFAGGWFHSGDLAVMHPDGYVEIKDRAKDIIISGGENISSLEVEEVLYKHPAVMEAAVVARPDDKWGETPQAFVTLKPDAPAVSAEDVIAWCRQHLAHYKCPRYVTFGPLPKTSTGKIQKFDLREKARGGVAA